MKKANEIFLGLGSNVGDRRKNIELAIKKINELESVELKKVSTLYETPAVLPKVSDKQNLGTEWLRPYVNLTISIQTSIDPYILLAKFKEIESQLGRNRREKWSPRPIDIDLLYSDGEPFSSTALTLPHSGILERSFVLDPLCEIQPTLRIDDKEFCTLKLAKNLPQRQPQLMKILNLTEDSFSDGGDNLHSSTWNSILDAIDREFVSIVDVGAESTRPGASRVAPEEEWQKLQPFIEFFRDRYHQKHIRPLLSIDTRNVATAEKCIEWGCDIINDVSGAAYPELLKITGQSRCKYVLMHSLSVPADPKKTIICEDPVAEIYQWLQDKLEECISAGIPRERIIIDPGIGFGKTTFQSIEILQRISEFNELGLPVLVGHSRKSFFGALTETKVTDRDPETLGASMHLINSGVDILRVHDVDLHSRALKSFYHFSSRSL